MLDASHHTSKHLVHIRQSQTVPAQHFNIRGAIYISARGGRLRSISCLIAELVCFMFVCAEQSKGSRLGARTTCPKALSMAVQCSLGAVIRGEGGGGGGGKGVLKQRSAISQ